MTVLLLGTRRSQLARTQSGLVADALTRHGHEVSLVEIVTEGDRSRAALAQIGGTGVFVGALRAALRTGEVDFAVHSLKDLPTEPEPDLVIAAIPMRVDPRDALVARDGLTLGELPAGAAIGTGSPRRAAQLAALGLGHTVAEIRGNVDTRLGYVRDGVLDAVILARAGLVRLGLAEAITETLDPLQMLPAAGQGALAVECRADRPDLVALLSVLDAPDTRACVDAERAVLRTLEAGCTAPVGALAEVAEGQDGVEVFLRVFVGSQDGAIELRRSMTGPLADPRALGARLATLVLDELADSGLAMSRPPAHIPASPRERGATAERRALDPLPVTETPQ